MGIWDDPVADWTTGDGLSAVQVFERAYTDRSAIRALAKRIGISWSSPLDASISLRELWVSLLTEAAATGLSLAFAEELLRDPARNQFKVPMVKLLGDWGAGLDSIASPGSGFEQPEQMRRMIDDATRRVALIRRAGKAAGTGFLVGPHLLLTAAHVLNLSEPPPSVQNLEAVFDFSVAGRSVDETGSAVPIVGLLQWSPPTDAEMTALSADWEAPGDRLDYALVELDGRSRYDRTFDGRGFYRLHDQEYDLRGDAYIFIPQHPVGMSLLFGRTTGTFEQNNARTRFRYRSNTLRGSSGAPLIDQNGRVVGVHHFSTARRNQAVPIWLIAEQLLAGEYSSRLLAELPTALPATPQPPPPAAADPYQVLQIGPHPFVNRHPLRDTLRRMSTPTGERSLVISGTAESGVTMSYYLISHIGGNAGLVPDLVLTAPEGLKAIKVDLRTHTAVAATERRAEIIREICRNLPFEMSDETMAQAARQVKDFKAWCAKNLRGSSSQWWFFIDSIDVMAEVTQHEIHEILLVLVELADDPQMPVRVVLAGRQADRLVELLHPLQYAATDRAEGLSRDEVAGWLGARLGEAGGAAGQARLAAALEEWFPEDGPPRQPTQLALAMAQVVREAAIS